MRIEAVVVKDFMGLRHVRARLHRTWVIVRGKNGSGKTSFLRAIESVLAGKNASPDLPVRVGAEYGSAEIDLGEIVAKRRWFDGDKSEFTLRFKNRQKQPTNPQTIIDQFFNRIAFDPLKFAKRKRPYVPIFRSTAASSTEPPVGACTCASGNQVCSGKSGTFTRNAIAKPRKTKSPAVKPQSTGSPPSLMPV
jgi:energy-coupling factor transporter ATP-binding protein EcfA2